MQARQYGEAVRQAIADLGMSQRQFAQTAQISESALSEIVHGRRIPSPKTAAHLARQLANERLPPLYEQARASLRRTKQARSPVRIESWESAPALTEDLVSFLRAVRSVTDELPYRIIGDRLPALTDVYVRQQVSSVPDTSPQDLAQEEPPERHLRASPEPEPAWRLRLAVDEVLGRHRHLLIQGAAGLGKSTLGYSLAGRLAKAWLDDGSPPPMQTPLLPVVVPARVLADHPQTTLAGAIAAAASAEVASYTETTLPLSAFTQPIDGVGWFVVIDALDEVPDLERRRRLFAQLAHTINDPGSPLRFLITTRPLSIGETMSLQSADVGFYELAPFDKHALTTFAGRWFNPRDTPAGHLRATRFLDQIKTSNLAQVLEVPLLAAVAALVHDQDLDTPLPANRYELYERYMRYIAHGRDKSGGTPGWFAEYQGPLLEELAEVYMASETPLLTVAREFLVKAAPDRSAGLTDAALIMLCNYSGLLSPVQGRLRFTHQTFAEHLAANAAARRLPEHFDETDERCADLLRKALRPEDLARRILLHYLHRPDKGPALLDLLQLGTWAQQDLAGSLVRDGAPVTDPQLLRHLERLDNQVRTRSEGSDGIRSLAGRLTDPRVHDLLLALAQDPGVQAGLRIDAVRTLAAGSVGFRPSAARLYAAITTLSDTIDTRITAAVALAELGTEQVDAAADQLTTVISDDSAEAMDKVQAASALAELGSSHQATAAALLTELAASGSAAAETRQRVAETLAEFSTEFRAAAGSILITLTDRRWPPSVRMTAAEALTRLGGAEQKAGARAIAELADDPSLPDSARVQADVTLARVSPEHRGAALGRIRAFATDRVHMSSQRITVLQSLGDLGPTYRDFVAGHLEAIALEPFTNFPRRFQDQYQAVHALLKLGPGYRHRAAILLRRFSDDHTNPASFRMSTIHEAAALDDNLHELAVAQTARFMNDPTQYRGSRQSAAVALAKLGRDERSQAVVAFQTLLADPRGSTPERLLAALVLIDIQPSSRWSMSALLDHLVPALTDSEDRVDAAEALLACHSGYAERAIEICGSVAVDPTTNGSLRTTAATQIHAISPKQHRHAAHLLQSLALDPTLDMYPRYSAASSLADMGGRCPEQAAEAMLSWARYTLSEVPYLDDARIAAEGFPPRQEQAERLLRDCATNPGLPPAWRIAAAEALAEIGPQWTDEAATVLADVARDVSLPADERHDAARCLADLGADHRATAAECLMMMIRCPDLAPPDRRQSARLLATWGEEQAGQASTAMRTTADDPAFSAPERALAASWLSKPGDDNIADLCQHLSAVAALPTTTWSDRIALLQHQATLQPATTRDLAAALAAAGAQVSPNDRFEAVQALLATGPEHHAEAAQVLTAIAMDPRTPPNHRLFAAGGLTNLHAETRNLGVAQLQMYAGDPTIAAEYRCRATRQLMELGPSHHHTAATLLEDIGTAADTAGWERLMAAENLARLGPRYRSRTVAIIRAVGEEAHLVDRVSAARMLAELGPAAGLGESAANLRRLLADLPPLTWQFRWTVGHMIGQGPDSREYVADVLRDAIAQPEAPGWHQLWMGCLLRTCGWQYAEEVHTGFARLAEERRTGSWARLKAVKLLLQAGNDHRRVAEPLLLAMVTDPGETPADRAVAAAAAARWGPDECRASTGILEHLVDSQPDSSVKVLQVLAAISPARRPALVSRLTALAADDSRPASDRVAAAAALAQVHYPSRPAAATVLSRVMISNDESQARLLAALELEKFGTRFYDQAAEPLRRLATDPAVSPFVTAMARAATCAGYTGAERAAADLLDAVVADPAVPERDRELALQQLVDLRYAFPGCQVGLV